MTTKYLGDQGEKRAQEYLEQNGLRLIDKNFSCKTGEIDLIMQDSNCVVFVEVRVRNNPHHGTGAESVTRSKIKKIIRTAEFFLKKNPLPQNLDCRFDVISLDDRIDWIKDAFTLDSF